MAAKTMPAKTRLGLTIFLTSFGIGLLALIVSYDSILASPEMVKLQKIAMGKVPASLIIFSSWAFTVLYLSFFLWMISKGKRWARDILLVLLLLGLYTEVANIIRLSITSFRGLTSAVVTVLQFYAMSLFYRKDSKVYFAAKDRSLTE